MPRLSHPGIGLVPRNTAVLSSALLVALTAACDPKIRVATISPTNSIASAQIVRMQPNGKEGNLYIAWRQTAPRTPSQVLFRKVHVTTSPMGPLHVLGTSERPLSELDMAVSGSHTYAVFEDRPPDAIAPDIMIAASSDDALTFAPVLNVSATTDNSLHPRVAASGASVFVAWIEQINTSRYEVRVRASTDGGATFGSSQVLSSNAPSLTPQIGIAGQEVFVAYCEAPGISYVRRLPVSGGTWGAPEPITSAGGTAVCGHEALASSVTTMFAVGVEYFGGYPQVFARRSASGGSFVPAGSQQLRVPEKLRAAATHHRVYIAALYDDSENYPRDIAVVRGESDTSLARPVFIKATPLAPLSFSMSAWGEYITIAWHGTPYSDNLLAVSNSHHAYGTSPSHRLVDADSNQVYGIYPDVQARDGDYYIVWRQEGTLGSSSIRLFSRRAWRLFD